MSEGINSAGSFPHSNSTSRHEAEQAFRQNYPIYENTSLQQDQLRILGVFAHPDDESFCAGGTFARYTNAGAEAMVVSATRGQAGQIRSAKVATRRTLGQVREQELRLACQRLGVQHVVCLDHGDGMLKEVEQEVLIGQVVEIIRSFRPDIVLTFGPDGGYGHPDHIAISTATTAACMRSGDTTQFPEHLAAGLAPHRPVRLYHSHFPAKRQLLLERLVQWLVTTEKRFHGTLDFVHALLLLTEESTLLRYSSDYCEVSWYPSGFFIIEQGEPADNLYLILSGTVEVMREDPNGTQHVVAQLGSGSFFGEEGLAYRKPRNAHVIAVDTVTCLVFSPNTPTAYLGRGEDAHITNLSGLDEQDEVHMTGVTTCIDVGPYMQQKIEAISAHRSQYAIEPDMLPLSILQELMGQEYFVRVYPVPEVETDFLPL